MTGFVLALGVAAIRGEPVPGPVDLGWSVLAGVLGAIGITALYRGLAVGRMGIVAPVTGVLAAVIPVIAGIILEGLPPPLVLAGIGLAVVAVVLVSRVTDEAGGRDGLGEALVGGVGIGLFGVVLNQLTDGVVFGPLALIRVTEGVVLVVVIVVTRTAWRPAPRLLPVILAIGVLDMAGNGLYILAIQVGLLAVASVLSALYPVVTVILATVLLGERVTRDHAMGIALAVVAIVAIGLGSA
jgi:drug/metabolite transporter (DMT)-like permease